MKTIKLPVRSTCAAVALVAVAALLAACGSSSSSSSSTTASASTGSASNTNRTALVACLKKHGITLPARRRPGAGGPPSGAPPSGASGSGSGRPPGGNPPRRGFFGGAANGSKFRAAFKACGANFPARGRFRAPNRQAIQKYVACVRSHGYKLPNPNFSGKGPIFPSNIRANKQFRSASKACQSLLTPTRSSSPSSKST